jgi:hypothetical protein
MIPVRAQGDEPAEARRFREEYKRGCEELVAFYSAITIEGSEDFQARGHKTEWEFASTAGKLRLVERRRSVREGAPSPLSAIVATPQLSFLLTRKEESSPYVVERMGRISAEELTRFEQGMIIRKTQLPWAPFSINGKPILELFGDQTFTIKRVEERTEAGQRVVRMAFEHSLENDQKAEGWVDLLPDSSWVVQAFETNAVVANPNGEKFKVGGHGVNEYLGYASGVPLIRKFTVWTTGEHGARSKDRLFEATKILPGAVPNSAFTPEAFGIVMSPAARPIPIVWYFGGLAAVCAALAALFWFLQSRKAM